MNCPSPSLLSAPCGSFDESGAAGRGVFDSTTTCEVEVRMPGLHLHRFALHRPAADACVIQCALRNWSRAVFFLDGDNHHGASGMSHVSPGTLILLPPGCRDERASKSGQLPLCIVIDFQLADSTPRTATTAVVRREDLLQARGQLAYWLRLQQEPAALQTCESTVVVLNVLVMLLRAAGWLPPASSTAPTVGEAAMHRLLLSMPLESPLGHVVERSGYQRDHLNRLIKRQTGLTLGQFRTQRRLDRAKELLARGVKVGDVAGEIGLPDQSYFARWFRRQTGFAPTQWLQTGGLKSSSPLAMCG